MAEVVGLTASVLTITATCAVVKSLYDTVKHYQGRNTTLMMLRAQLEEILNILNALEKVPDIDESLWLLLQGPINRCKEMCRDFEKAMNSFSNSKTQVGLRDWAKLEFRKATITEFIDRIAGYKSTITVGLGIINLEVLIHTYLQNHANIPYSHSSKVSQEVLRQYMDMAQRTADELKLQLQRIDEKMADLSSEDGPPSDISLDLRDEKAVTKKCLRICQDAKNYIEALTSKQSFILPKTVPNTAGHAVQQSFESQLATRQVMDESRDKLTETITRLVNRLDCLVQENGADVHEERMRLQDDLEVSKQCLEVCKVATEMTRQRIYRVGETNADGNSDLVVVNTLSDLFDVGVARSTDNSAHLVASITSEDFREVVAQRYNSRFGAVVAKSSSTEAGTSTPPHAVQDRSTRVTAPATSEGAQRTEQKPGYKRPSPNENRRRSTKDEDNE